LKGVQALKVVLLEVVLVVVLVVLVLLLRYPADKSGSWLSPRTGSICRECPSRMSYRPPLRS